MGVEIRILSGARQGEQLVLDRSEFRAGADPACEILFDAQLDPAIRGRTTLFRRQEDGWYLHGEGCEILVNHQAIAGWTRVRSGDVIRMSDSGPDFSFNLAAGTAPPQVRMPILSADRASPCIQSPAVAGPSIAIPFPRSTVRKSDGRASGLSQVETHANAAVLTRVTPAKPFDRRWLLGIGGIGVIVVLALLLRQSLLFRPTIIVNVPSSPPPAASTEPGAPLPPPVPDVPVSQPGTGTASGDVNPDIGARLEEAALLLQVEKAGHCWPYATCLAVSGNTLLTTAREAAQLARWRDQSGFKIWATRPSSGFKEEVREIRVNAVFASLEAKANDWIYYDSGLLTVDGPIAKVVPIASRAELADLEPGMAVFCCGFTHEGEKLTRFDRLEPRFTAGKLYVISVAKNLPGQPRLLHLKAEIPKNAYGSAVVNAEGKVIGLYGETASPPSGEAGTAAGIKNMHYVTVVNPEMVDRWLQGDGQQFWLPAAATKPSKDP
jgi:hypothetical protein